MLFDVEQAEAALRAAEGYVQGVMRPELPLPVAAQMNEATEHGHLTPLQRDPLVKSL